jgi:hypothetical protein
MPLLLSLLVAAPVGAASLQGVSFSERVRAGGTDLVLNGLALLRYRVLFKGYVAALYLGEDVSPKQVLEDVPRRLEIEYFWSIPADAFARATQEGIARNVDAGRLEALRERIEQLNALYADVEPGDRYALTYLPGRGTELSLNGRVRGSIPGADFSAAVFSIWLGEAPLDDSLKDALLGGPAAPSGSS